VGALGMNAKKPGERLKTTDGARVSRKNSSKASGLRPSGSNQSGHLLGRDLDEGAKVQRDRIQREPLATVVKDGVTRTRRP